MEIAKIQVSATTGRCLSRRQIPARLVGGTVSVEFADPIWDRLNKTVVFRCGESRIAEFDGTTAIIPWEILEEPGKRLYFGIWGNAPDAELQIPLIEVPIGVVETATDPGADPGTDPTLPVWADLKNRVEQLEQNGTGGPGTPGQDGEDGGYYRPDVTQPETDTIRFAFTPSKTNMPSVQPVTVKIPHSNEDIDLTGYATKQWVEDQKYLTAVPNDIKSDIADAKEIAGKADAKVEKLREVVSKFHSNIVETASGDVITVSDSSDMELAGLRIFGKTTQNGTPTPDAPVPLESVGDSGSVGVTVAGKNLLKPTLTATTTQNGITCIPNGDGTFTVSGTATQSTYIIVGKLRPTTQNLRVCGCPSGGSNSKYYVYIASTYEGEYGTGGGIKAFDKERDICIAIMNGITVSNLVFKPMITADLNATYDDYEPYKEAQGLTIQKPENVPVFLPGMPVTSGGNCTDENSQQWICDEVDFESGKYVQRVATKTFNGTESGWNRLSSGNQAYWLNIPDMKAYYEAPAYCTHFVHRTGGLDDGVFGKSDMCYFNYSGATSIAEWKAWLAENPITVCYVLTEPIEHELTDEELAQYAALHTNYPNTTVFNDGGAAMEVKYVADTKLYIDKKFAELSTALLNQ